MRFPVLFSGRSKTSCKVEISQVNIKGGVMCKTVSEMIFEKIWTIKENKMEKNLYPITLAVSRLNNLYIL